jgi:hypothetical protein
MPRPSLVETLRPQELTGARRDSMFALMQSYYDGVSHEQFLKDLQAKEFAVNILDEDGKVAGFSTMAVWNETYRGRAIRVIFSGDTIIARDYWGSAAFANAWIKLVAKIKSAAPDEPLYWLLIVKGHRTYRHLPVFTNDYHPRWDASAPRDIQDLMNHLAQKHFGDNYSAQTGLLRFKAQRGKLKPVWAAVPEKDATRPEVQYFLERNPGYAEGDELVCFAEVCNSNLKPYARRIFAASFPG